MMGFEFDPAKNLITQGKHRMGFETAQALWLDERGHEYFSRVVESEYRYARVAQIEGKSWTAIFTYRKKKKKPNGKRKKNIRLITVRRARPKEDAQYRQLLALATIEPP
jgi:uncharacterized DUF497 family protein